jgi:Peptidase C13 family
VKLCIYVGPGGSARRSSVAPSVSPVRAVEDARKVRVVSLADANHPSFGCRDKAKWTYFGNAFFNIALRQAKSLKGAFVGARSPVKKPEVHERFEPSDPVCTENSIRHRRSKRTA